MNLLKRPNSKKLGFIFFMLTLLLHAGPARSKCPEGYRDISLKKNNWINQYPNSGKVSFQEKKNMISMTPKTALVSATTHASLVLSKFDIKSENFDIIVDYKNERALRKKNPNPWEVFWLFFNYVPGPHHTKTTNYVIAKPNGLEVGRAAKEIDQAYVKTSEQVSAKFNQWHRLRVQKQGEIVKFYFDGIYILEVSTSVLFTAHGRIGLYSEDAAVTVKRVCLK